MVSLMHHFPYYAAIEERGAGLATAMTTISQKAAAITGYHDLPQERLVIPLRLCRF
jgi:hypothetical protein